MKKLPLRKNVLGVVFLGNEFLIVQKNNYNEDEWAFPGGGVDEGETEEQALIRELKEELGTSKFEIIKKSPERHVWDWPIPLVKERGSKHRGQDAAFFYVKFFGEKSEISIDKDELRKAKWIKKNDFEKHFIFPGQMDSVREVLEKAPGGD